MHVIVIIDWLSLLGLLQAPLLLLHLLILTPVN